MQIPQLVYFDLVTSYSSFTKLLIRLLARVSREQHRSQSRRNKAGSSASAGKGTKRNASERSLPRRHTLFLPRARAYPTSDSPNRDPISLFIRSRKREPKIGAGAVAGIMDELVTAKAHKLAQTCLRRRRIARGRPARADRLRD